MVHFRESFCKSNLVRPIQVFQLYQWMDIHGHWTTRTSESPLWEYVNLTIEYWPYSGICSRIPANTFLRHLLLHVDAIACRQYSYKHAQIHIHIVDIISETLNQTSSQRVISCTYVFNTPTHAALVGTRSINKYDELPASISTSLSRR